MNKIFDLAREKHIKNLISRYFTLIHSKNILLNRNDLPDKEEKCQQIENAIQSLKNTLHTIIFEYIHYLKKTRKTYLINSKKISILKKCLFHDEISMFMFWKDIEDEQTAQKAFARYNEYLIQDLNIHKKTFKFKYFSLSVVGIIGLYALMVSIRNLFLSNIKYFIHCGLCFACMLVIFLIILFCYKK